LGSTADGSHRLLTDLRDIAGNTAKCNFWIKATCVVETSLRNDVLYFRFPTNLKFSK